MSECFPECRNEQGYQGMKCKTVGRVRVNALILQKTSDLIAIDE